LQACACNGLSAPQTQRQLPRPQSIYFLTGPSPVALVGAAPVVAGLCSSLCGVCLLLYTLPPMDVPSRGGLAFLACKLGGLGAGAPLSQGLSLRQCSAPEANCAFGCASVCSQSLCSIVPPMATQVAEQGRTKCPEHVLQAIYGTAQDKRKQYEQSLNRCGASAHSLHCRCARHAAEHPPALAGAAGGRSTRPGRTTRRTSTWRTRCCTT